MEALLVAVTVIDVVAVVALAWLVIRGARERELGLATQRSALERLRTELTQLLDEAERRAHRLECATAHEGASGRCAEVASSESDAAERRLRRELELALGTERPGPADFTLRHPYGAHGRTAGTRVADLA